MSSFPPTNIPGNSKNPKPPRPKLERVVQHEAIVREAPLAKRVKETFTVEATKTIAEYVLFEVVIPNFKMLILDVVNQGLERKFYGDGRPRGTSYSTPSRSGPGTDYIPYNRMYKQRQTPSGALGLRDITTAARASHDFNEIVLASRGEAEKVLDVLIRRIADYDVTTVYDLYELVGITSNFTDEKYGWNDLSGASIRRCREGYLLVLPTPMVLD